MREYPGGNEQACRDGLEPVDDQRGACRPPAGEPAGRRDSVDRQQRQKMNDPGHVVAAVRRGMRLSSHRHPKTFTALAITSVAVDRATIACTVIIILPHRASGMVSVGENATTLVKLT